MKALAKALMGAQAEFKAIKKGSTNPHFKSKYATLEDCIDGTRAILAAHGLVVSQVTTFIPEGAVVLLETTLTHCESGESRTSQWPLLPGKANDPQALGSALTYARRYAHTTIIGAVTSDEDDDGNAASGRDDGKKDAKQRVVKATETALAKGLPTNGDVIGEGKAVIWDTARKLWPVKDEHTAQIKALLARHNVNATDKLPAGKDGVSAYVNELNEAKRLEKPNA